MQRHLNQRARRLGAEMGNLLADLAALEHAFAALRRVPDGAEAPVSSFEYLRAYA